MLFYRNFSLALVITSSSFALALDQENFTQEVLGFIVHEKVNSGSDSKHVGSAIPTIHPQRLTPDIDLVNKSAPSLQLIKANDLVSGEGSTEEFVQSDFRVETGLFFDLNKGEDDDCGEEKKKDDCEGGLLSWFWPFSVDNSTSLERPQIELPTEVLMSPAFDDSHGLFSSERLEDNIDLVNILTRPTKLTSYANEKNLTNETNLTVSNNVINVTLKESNETVFDLEILQPNETENDEDDIFESKGSKLSATELVVILLICLGII